MNYSAGDLDQRITIEKKTMARDGAGGATATWSTRATVWAGMKPLTGRERENAMRNEATSKYLVVIRYRSDISDTDRISWRGRYLNITFQRKAGPRPLYLEIEAEIGAPS